MNRVRNVHSPAGMGFSLYGTQLVKLEDCPNCKYGTVDRVKHISKGKVLYRCADCKARFYRAK